MNRSRYVPQAYPVSSYQPYGSIPTTAAPQGMMPTQPMAMAPPTYGSISAQQGMGQSPIQTQLSPNSMWTTAFPNGPIIEDLVAPPMGIPSASPPMNAFPPRMAAMTQMHPGAMPQVQNVFGVRQPMPHQFTGMQGLADGFAADGGQSRGPTCGDGAADAGGELVGRIFVA
ncbi:hypothetical protein MMYC01_205094 [Madurella mycetomatis]|uniref:Uncharacterized protein n=1 Tax=Madurella mycetomatis TaxID=100816 RepID=A0A175W375_9PEZI|nr:hypothetical protein MMYC01_205094 [Madurella mycetomatis]